MDDTDKEVYQYYINGTYTGFHFTVAINGNTPVGITMNNTYFWITDWGYAEVYQYYINGTYTGFHFDTAVSGNGNPYDITMNDTYFWILDNIDEGIYQYTHDGTYTGNYFNGRVYPTSDILGIVMYENFFWISDMTMDKVFQFNHNGVYTGTSFNLTPSNNYASCIATNGTYFLVTDFLIAEVYQYYNNIIPITSSLKTEHLTNSTIFTNTSNPYFTWSYSDTETQYSWEI